MKKVLIAFVGVVSISGAVMAGRYSVKATPADLYAKNTVTNACVRLVNNLGDPSAQFSDTNPIGSSKIISAGNTQYTLWDNAACSTASGGKQIAFL